jgi:hypothetical protein
MDGKRKGDEERRRDAPYRLISTYKIDCCSLNDFSSDPDRTASIDPSQHALIEAVGTHFARFGVGRVRVHDRSRSNKRSNKHIHGTCGLLEDMVLLYDMCTISCDFIHRSVVCGTPTWACVDFATSGAEG